MTRIFACVYHLFAKRRFPTSASALSRLKSLSDDDLMLVLEQVHGSTFPFSLTAPSLHNTDDTTLSAPSSSSSSNFSNASATQDPLTDRQASHSLASSSSGSVAKDDKPMPAAQSPSAPVTGAKLPDAPVGQQAKDAVEKLPGLDEKLQQAKGIAGKLPDVSRMRQEAKAAADALPDAWQQQTFRLQAFTRPLMQRLQSVPHFFLPDWLTQVVQVYCLSPSCALSVSHLSSTKEPAIKELSIYRALTISHVSVTWCRAVVRLTEWPMQVLQARHRPASQRLRPSSHKQELHKLRLAAAHCQARSQVPASNKLLLTLSSKTHLTKAQHRQLRKRQRQAVLVSKWSLLLS